MHTHDPAEWLAPRYTSDPWPAYRFVPGESPHPTAHADGHSYGHEPDATYYGPERWQDSPDYRFGADLYNHAYWWEAHEAWEGLWQLTDKRGTQGRFLQGLIQTSATHLKFLLGHERGYDRLRETSRAYLDETVQVVGGPVYMGVDIPALCAAVDAYYADRPLGVAHDPAAYPYVTLAVSPK